MTDVLLGLDIGTSSAKAVLATPDGELLATAERAHATARPRPGWVEHDAEAVWWAAVVELCRDLAAQGPWPPAAVCVSGLGPCLLPADAAGRPLRPAILYGVDTRAQAEIAELTEQLGADAVLARGGSALSTQAVGPKLLWLRRREPEVWSATRRLLMASSYAVQQLTGEYVLDHHSASQCDPLYDLAAGDWYAPWAEAIAPGLPLPRLLWPGEAAGAVTAAAAGATGLRQGTPVAAGTVDAWAEALSAGVRAPGDAMLMYGTTMFFVAVESGPSPDPRLWLTAGVEPGTRTLAAGMATSGALTAWLREVAGDVPYPQLLQEAAAVPAGSDALVALPYFAGERTPVFDPRARGVICGLTLSHGRGHLYRALLEATAYGVRHNLEAFADAGAAPRRLVAVGGGTRGSLWTQIVSDVTGRAQELPAQTIGASYGDAWLAGRAAGLVEPAARWNPVAAVVVPDEDAGAAYEPLYAVYRELYPATRAQAHALAALQET
jgi:xylulokinase